MLTLVAVLLAQLGPEPSVPPPTPRPPGMMSKWGPLPPAGTWEITAYAPDGSMTRMGEFPTREACEAKIPVFTRGHRLFHASCRQIPLADTSPADPGK
jgi:hypothetical protein